ncbi:MAG: acetyl-CoA decarbonylase/synthase complex subunit alpha/beta, partial [Oscillospiraceae bacterium]
MSVLTDLIYGGSNAVAGLTEGAVNDAIAKYGADKVISFPDTAYFFPTIYAATGVKVKTLGDLVPCVGVLKSLITNQEDLGQALNAGLATAVGAEIIEGLKYVEGGNPYENETGIGFVPDPIIRSLGVPLVTGDIPGVAVVLGKADNAADVVNVVKDYQSKGIMTFMVGDVIEQCAEGGVKMGLEFRVIPLGHDVTSVIHVVTVAIRAALIFGNVKPGDLAGLLTYTKERVPAFVNTFGAIDAVVVSAGAGAIALGFPVVVDVDLGENQVPGALESVCDHAETVKKSLELRSIKIKVKELPIPVAFAAAFEGEIIRKSDMHNEFWSSKNPTAELVLMRDMNEVEDHKITIIGPDLCDAKDLALGTFVEVAGKKMQADFEAVIERKFHAWFNYMEGVMHTGQRNQVRVRVSNGAFEAGLNVRHFAEVLYVMIMDEFDAVVDKCQVTIITDAAEASKFRDELAMPRYAARDARLESLTDESVDRYYTCILCQSFAPAHVCVVTPERLGLCGAVSWLDAKATNELDPNGPCQPIFKEGCTDERTGRYQSVDKAVFDATHGAIETVTLYSILEDPMTSCGCFECICGIEPMSNGVIIVNREFGGMTPAGMTFGELASCTGGGVQTPGYMGHGRHFIASKKFCSAEGGIE